MEEIKLGEYIRTKQGYMAKFIHVNNTYGLLEFDKTIWKECYKPKTTISFSNFKKIVKKHSSNIIDLIEVGDYVNGKLVKHIADFEGVKEPIRKLIFVDEHRLVPGETVKNDEIKSICTREQFEDAKYRLYRLEEVKDE